MKRFQWMGSRKGRPALLFAVLLVGTGTARADFVNGGFESGDFTGWSTKGSTSVLVGGAPEGSHYAHLSASGVGKTELETFLGLTAGTLDAVAPNHQATNGSAIEQTVTVSAGATLHFKYDFKANDYLPYNDFSFFSVSDSATLLSSVSLVGNYGTTGWKDYSYTFATGGTYTVGFGVMNAIDQGYNSELSVDDVHTITTVPVPAGAVLLLTGLPAVALFRRFRRA